MLLRITTLLHPHSVHISICPWTASPPPYPGISAISSPGACDSREKAANELPEHMLVGVRPMMLELLVLEISCRTGAPCHRPR